MLDFHSKESMILFSPRLHVYNHFTENLSFGVVVFLWKPVACSTPKSGTFVFALLLCHESSAYISS